jgi:hypothetical protein
MNRSLSLRFLVSPKWPLIVAPIVLLFLACGSSPQENKDKSDKKKSSEAQEERKYLTGPLKEEKCAVLFEANDIPDAFEASGVFYQQGQCYLVFDNMQMIGRADATLAKATGNLLGPGKRKTSNFEGITGDGKGGFYVVSEMEKKSKEQIPYLYHFDSSLKNTGNWPLAYTLDKANAGFEGIARVSRNGKEYLLFLMEGTGKVVVFAQQQAQWTSEAEFNLPVSFKDYSDIAVNGNTMAVASQEDATLWVGALAGDKWAVDGSGATYHFPRGDKNGELGKGNKVLYANVEGVAFVNDSTIVTCTDRIKQSQNAHHAIKDQSVQIFRIR